MAASADANPLTTVLVPGYDPAGHQSRVALHMANVTTDNTVNPPITYGDLVTTLGAGTQTVTETNSAAILAALDDGQENMANSLSVTVASDQSPVPTLLQATSGTNLTADQANTILKVSLYGKAVSNADTPILVNGSGGIFAVQAGAWTVQPGNTANTTAWLIHADNDGQSTTPVAASTSANTIIKAVSGRLARVLITATGTNQMNIYDNATTNSGTIIGAIPANPSIGQVFEFMMPAANGITVGGNANNPGVTISWT
jgi:hypothetical protein